MTIDFMIVDDEKSITELLTVLLSSRFPESNIETYFNPIDAYSQLEKKQKTYFIISDTNMPEMTGLQLHDKAKKLNAFSGFILISALPKYENEANKRGIGFLQKPFKFDSVYELIKKTLALSKSS